MRHVVTLGKEEKPIQNCNLKNETIQKTQAETEG
jgi:hypothetical protein